MKKLNHLLRVLPGKAAVRVVLTLMFVAASLPLFAQTAEVRYAGVFYKDMTLSGTGQPSDSKIRQVYCDWQDPAAKASNFRLNTSRPQFYSDTALGTASGLSVNDIQQDGDYWVQLIQKGVKNNLGNYRSTSKNYKPYDMFYVDYQRKETIGYDAFGDPIEVFVTYYDIYQITGYASPAAGYLVDITKGSADNRSFTSDPDPTQNGHKWDPWASSALIEYDQPYGSPNPNPSLVGTDYNYPNHCLALCMNVYCQNKPIGGSTYSISFPLQQVKFDIVKYYNNKNIANPEESPAVRTIDLYPNVEEARCASYTCPGGTTSGNTCNGAEYFSTENETKPDECYSFKDGSAASGKCECKNCDKNGNGCSCNFAVFGGNGTPSIGTEAIPFCAVWDGSYEIAGEFGKSNGQFGFRATVATDVPGDNVITDKIEFSSVIAYPGENQIPMQVDVTNVHTVRSTPTVVGNITAVSAQPYTFAYRLSKDADVRVAVFDASSSDDLAYYGTDRNLAASNSNEAGNKSAIVRMITDWQPRLGEGMKGQEKDVQITEFDSWDGRNDDGLLLPAGNYIVTIQAKSQDEWDGIDFSRAVTRQMSLDPLKLTDIVATGLNKKSTAYASISYVPTEASKVYWQVYTPGTVFEETLTDSSTQTGTAPTVKSIIPGSLDTGYLVYSAEEDRTARMNFTSKWDGLCHKTATSGTHAEGCTRVYAQGEKLSTGEICGAIGGRPFESGTNVCKETFRIGAPMPDGNYIYVLWAEIPYNGKYLNRLGTSSKTIPNFTPGFICSGTGDEINGQCFTGVKTLNYEVGQVAVERGMVDITIQPVSYSTVGSSPTAYGLDPFIFKYSVVRDSTVIAQVVNSAGVNVKYLTPEDGVTQVAQQLNTLSWDGRDDQGRMVTPGTYMFKVQTKDPMFPSITNSAVAVFPVDMYRVVDVATTDVYGDSEAKATISYSLSKAMNVQVNIYNKDVVIPDYNRETGSYDSYTVTATYTGTAYTNTLGTPLTVALVGGPTVSVTPTAPGTDITLVGTTTRRTVTVTTNPNYVPGSTTPGEEEFLVTVKEETVTLNSAGTTAWPPRVCNRGDLRSYGYTALDPIVVRGEAVVNAIDPRTQPTCIYVNDPFFNNYPTAAEAAAGVVDVRLQPVKTFERSALRVGDGLTITEEWDALYFNNPTSTKQPGACVGATSLKDCPYEMVPDGQYPFYISAQSEEPFNRYYANDTESDISGNPYLQGAPFKTPAEIKPQDGLYATEKPTGKINVTRGPVYFLDGSVVVYPNAPQLFNASSGPVFIPPYEINFSVSRASTVEVDIVALEAGVCHDQPGRLNQLNTAPGAVCKHIDPVTFINTSNFDPNIARKVYWDGTDNNGYYVKPGVYEVRLTAKNYPDATLYQETVKSITLNADILKVFDLLEADGYAISQRGTDMKIGYQISVPMKVAVQFFKPGTTIYDYQKGTLRNPATGLEVQDIREVLVRAIVGIRPATTLIEELWDGRDYAQQEVPDGTYPFRFVTALDSADIDSVTGEIVGDYASTDGSTNQSNWKINKVADTYEYQNLHRATIAIGDGRFVCEDWEKTVTFYPNPLVPTLKNDGTLEITKMPVPGEVSIKFFNLAGDLVRDGGYTCVDANNYEVVMGKSLKFQPDNNISTTLGTSFTDMRNAALRCRWDRTNQHGKKVARGVYFGLVDFKATHGREHCQKVVKILVP